MICEIRIPSNIINKKPQLRFCRWGFKKVPREWDVLAALTETVLYVLLICSAHFKRQLSNHVVSPTPLRIKKALDHRRMKKCFLHAEGVGFEPTVRCRTPVFKTGALNRSAIPPRGLKAKLANKRKRFFIFIFL